MYRHTVLLEYFAGEKPLWMSQIITLCDLNIAFWQGSCVFTSNNLGFVDFIVANWSTLAKFANVWCSQNILVIRYTVHQIRYMRSVTWLLYNNLCHWFCICTLIQLVWMVWCNLLLEFAHLDWSVCKFQAGDRYKKSRYSPHTSDARTVCIRIIFV